MYHELLFENQCPEKNKMIGPEPELHLPRHSTLDNEIRLGV
jgi:hypothetical protein